MSHGSIEIPLWMEEDRYTAVQKILRGSGTDLKSVMQAKLEEVYCQTVPEQERARIGSILEVERLKEEQSRRFTIFHITENGEDGFWRKEGETNFHQTASLLRRYLRGEEKTGFAEKLYRAEKITEAQFDEMSRERMENTGRINGAYDINLDAGEFSALHIMDGWMTFQIRDVCTAAYCAERKQGLLPKQTLSRFLEALDGKELQDCQEDTENFELQL